MEGYYTYPESTVGAPRKKRIAVVTQGVKLGDETRGYTRFRFIAQALAEAGFDVDLITSTFQHWDKAQRDTTLACYKGLPYQIQFIYEPGYKRNLDLARINSHRVLAGNLRRFFKDRFANNPTAYDLIYSEIPPNDMARACAEIARENGIPYVPDINDLWPEAMRMAVDVPVLSDIAFSPFARDAKKTYGLIAAAVGTSDEYANQPSKYRDDNYRRITVYVGNELEKFDSGAAAQADAIEKPDGELWVIYAGTLGASYDIATLIDAAVIAMRENPSIRVKILGDGPDRAKLEEQAARLNAPVD
ncbi:MAG: glycosyltransferase WbuB, partial [Eggerthellaceae bacterium]|nr:glycosyltransferase WbuB [Eggerthellaceae bacterium]